MQLPCPWGFAVACRRRGWQSAVEVGGRGAGAGRLGCFGRGAGRESVYSQQHPEARIAVSDQRLTHVLVPGVAPFQKPAPVAHLPFALPFPLLRRPHLSDESDIIEAFQERRRAFQARWNAHFFRRILPRFLAFAAALFIPPPLQWPVAIGAFAWFAWGFGTGVALLLEMRRCPRCEAVQRPNIQFPFRQCGGCGARLSHGVRDST